MPCRTYTTEEELDTSSANLAEREAMLCGILRVLESKKKLQAILDAFNEEEAGVTTQALRKWWSEHKKRDDDRKRREAEEAELKKLRESARKKLSDKERAALKLD